LAGQFKQAPSIEKPLYFNSSNPAMSSVRPAKGRNMQAFAPVLGVAVHCARGMFNLHLPGGQLIFCCL
jgi:hypothetical protein